MPNNWDEDLPDASNWKPKSPNNYTLRNALQVTCQVAQARITSRSNAERTFNLYNFDSGSGVEDIVREELANLLPERYSVECGVVNDRRGQTAGDCDLIVRDRTWSPVIKLGATSNSRRFHFPIEGIYATTEIKQTLGFDQLDEAMEKLVTLSKLERPENPYGHITENQHLEWLDKPGLILNPLHTTVFATGLGEGTTFVDVAKRFGKINATLPRAHMVKLLCVLDHGTAWYSVETGTPIDATFMYDRNQALVLQVNNKEPENAFYRFFVLLLLHLTRSVLGFESMMAEYGTPPPDRVIFKYEDAEFNREAH